MNSILGVIKSRRTIVRFSENPVEDEKVKTILEAGRWAPSWLNKQPWVFIVIKDHNIKHQLSNVVPTIFKNGIREAPLCVTIAVDTEQDPYHFIEDGAAASENMLLAATSLGLHSCWIGVLSPEKDANRSTENIVKKLLGIPKNFRALSILLFGYGRKDLPIPKKERKPLEQIVLQNKF
ncbi:MAG: nitroreductase family protein [Candidatus Bathyarchaeota archaeon]|nr:MAG: nitroreductase family protein [Candidatus Bathyarchaeota archaeon]